MKGEVETSSITKKTKKKEKKSQLAEFTIRKIICLINHSTRVGMHISPTMQFNLHFREKVPALPF